MQKATILVVDDEISMRKFFEVTLKREGYRVVCADSVAEGCTAIASETYDLLLSDIKLGDGQGLELLARSKKKDSDIPVIMMTAYASPETAVEAMKLGAVDYLTKPFNVDEVRVVVRNNLRTRSIIEENKSLKRQLSVQKPKMIYKSERMASLIATLKRVARLDTTILVTGESGTGKELFMRSIHDMSPRAKAPYISVNCGALPESLFESELFGYEKGSFTGADTQRMGLFEAAHGGTLFLDEIGEMPLKMQIKLLRVLQEKTIRRVGGTQEIAVDFRLLSATNRNLEEEVKQNNFREDLFYRINVVPISLPPLRQRREDIMPLVKHFIERFCAQCNEEPKEISPDVIRQFDRYNWPGNVRELENTMERLVALVPDKNIKMTDLPNNIADCREADDLPDMHIPATGMDLEAYLDQVRFRFMKKSLEMTGGVQSKSCELLGMTFRSFRYYLSKAREQGEID